MFKISFFCSVFFVFSNLNSSFKKIEFNCKNKNIFLLEFDPKFFEVKKKFEIDLFEQQEKNDSFIESFLDFMEKSDCEDCTVYPFCFPRKEIYLPGGKSFLLYDINDNKFLSILIFNQTIEAENPIIRNFIESGEAEEDISYFDILIEKDKNNNPLFLSFINKSIENVKDENKFINNIFIDIKNNKNKKLVEILFNIK
jgi:hypothetical protein